MPLANFNVVLLGDSFPVSSLRVADFTYRHRALNETLRVPVALQAENEIVEIQVLPDRFQVNIKAPDDVPVQSAGVAEMVDTFLEYVGRRTVTAVGHNVQWRVQGSEGHKAEIVEALTKRDSVAAIIGDPEYTADVSIFFHSGNGTRARLLIPTQPSGDVLLDFNFNYDLSVYGGDARRAVGELAASVAAATILSERLQTTLLGVQA